MPSGDSGRPVIAQVAISSLDADRSREWYRDGLGYRPAGMIEPTADLSAVQGVPEAKVARVLWLVDRQEFFQLEIFDYASPVVRPQPIDRRRNDIGYTALGVWVADLDETLAALLTLGTEPIGAVVGAAGSRRVCVQDPDAILVELREHDFGPPGSSAPVRADIPVATRSVTASVPDLDRALRYFASALGLRPGEVVLHTEDDETMWDLASARSRRAVLDGGGLWLELVEYLDPPGRPRSDGYRISDQGVLNIALGSRSRAGFRAVRDSAVAAGYAVHTEVARELINIQYAIDADGFSVELAYFDVSLDARQGFEPMIAP